MRIFAPALSSIRSSISSATLRSPTSPASSLDLTPGGGARYSVSLVKRDAAANRRPPGRVFWLAVIFGTSGMVAAAVSVGTAIGSVHRASMGAGHFDVAGLALSYPQLNGAEWLLIGLAAFGASAITMAWRATWRQRCAYRTFLDGLK